MEEITLESGYPDSSQSESDLFIWGDGTEPETEPEAVDVIPEAIPDGEITISEGGEITTAEDETIFLDVIEGDNQTEQIPENVGIIENLIENADGLLEQTPANITPHEANENLEQTETIDELKKITLSLQTIEETLTSESSEDEKNIILEDEEGQETNEHTLDEIYDLFVDLNEKVEYMTLQNERTWKDTATYQSTTTGILLLLLGSFVGYIIFAKLYG